MTNQQGEPEYFQGLTRRQLTDCQRLLAVLGGEALSRIADEMEDAASCGRVTDVTIGFDQTGKPVVLGTYRKRSLTR